MLKNDIKYNNDENNNPLHGQPTKANIYMNAIQTFFQDSDEKSKVSIYMLSISKIYACYKLDAKSSLLKIIDNSKLTSSSDLPIVHTRKINMTYISDHAFGDHIAVLFKRDSQIVTLKYCLQIYNKKLY